MVSSTVQATITEKIEDAIATLQARGAPITNESVRALAQVGRNSAKDYLKAWRSQQRVARQPVDQIPMGTLTPPAPPRPAPVSPLVAQRQQCAEDDEAWRDLERETQQLAQDRAEHWADYRHALTEAKRLAPLYLRAYQASRLALYGGNEGVQEETQRLRSYLVGLVGEQDVAQLETDPAYRPWWLRA
jgi:hypothetical protein